MVIAIANQKGGVAKSTTVVSLAAVLAERGRRVLVIDNDPQGSASAMLGADLAATRGRSVYEAVYRRAVAPEEAVVTKHGVDLLPANVYLASAELELAAEPGREAVLREALATIGPGYDHVLIDCPPSLGLLTLNALTAASGVVVPVAATDYMAVWGLELLLDTIARVRRRLNPALDVAGVLLTRARRGTGLASQIAQLVRREMAARQVAVLGAAIPERIAAAEAPVRGEPVTAFNAAAPVADAYRAAARELFEGGVSV